MVISIAPEFRAKMPDTVLRQRGRCELVHVGVNGKQCPDSYDYCDRQKELPEDLHDAGGLTPIAPHAA